MLLTVSGPVPAVGHQRRARHAHAPEPERVPDVRARPSDRTSATKVDTWSIWNEPNQPQFLLPQYSAHHTPLSPGIYRKLFLAALRGLRRRRPRRRRACCMGETSPRGTGKVVAPLTFLRGVLCLDSKYHKTQHELREAAAPPATPITPTRRGQGPFFKPAAAQRRDDRRALAADHARSTAPRRPARSRSHLPIYLTEFGIQSTPDPVLGVSLQRQAEYRAISERIAYDNPRVVAFSQYLLRDDLPKAGVPAARSATAASSPACARRPARPSPSLDGFRLPLGRAAQGSRRSRSGASCGRPPARRRRRIEYAAKGGSFHTLRTVHDRRARLLRQERGATRSGRAVAPASGRRPDGTAFRGDRRPAPTPGASLPARMAQQLWLLRHGEAEPHDARPDAERRADRPRRASSRAPRAARWRRSTLAGPRSSSRARRCAPATPRVLACEALGVEPVEHARAGRGLRRRATRSSSWPPRVPTSACSSSATSPTSPRSSTT